MSYINSKTQKHIDFSDGHNYSGWSNFLSINWHLGYETSRRDDLEQLGYVLLYFLKQGQLPWIGLQFERANGASKKERQQQRAKQVGNVKMGILVDELCKGFPNAFKEYLQYCRRLKFDQIPDYKYLKNLFINVGKQNKFSLNDGQFDWILHAQVKSRQSWIENDLVYIVIATCNYLAFHS